MEHSCRTLQLSFTAVARYSVSTMYIIPGSPQLAKHFLFGLLRHCVLEVHFPAQTAVRRNTIGDGRVDLLQLIVQLVQFSVLEERSFSSKT